VNRPGPELPCVSRWILAFACLAQAPGASAQGVPSWQFGADAQHTGRQDLRGPRATPSIVWRIRAAHRIAASPALGASGTIAFVGVDGMVHVVDGFGVERSAWSSGHAVYASPAARGASLLVAHDGGGLAAIDARGTPAWTVSTSHDVDASPAVGTDGTVYIASRTVEAIDTRGTVRWRTAVGSPVFGAPALSVDGRLLYVATMAGELFVLRSSDGSLERRLRVGASVHGGALVLADGAVVLGAFDGHVRAWNPDGSLRWDVATRDGVRSTPALGRDGTIVVGSDDGGIYGLRAHDGSTMFRAATHGRVRASARIDADGWIYVGSEDDVLYALDPSGTIAWTLALGADIDSSAVIPANGALAVGCDDAGLYYLR